MPAIANMLNLPTELRANDVVSHCISIDSRFRQNPASTSSSDFFIRMLTPIRNVLRVRVTSIELPNNYYNFTAARKNVSLRIYYGPVTPSRPYYDIVIPDGNYSVNDMISALNVAFAAAPVGILTGMQVEPFNVVTGHFTIIWNAPFTLDTTFGSAVRPIEYGLGYNLGFSYGTFDASGSGVAYSLRSNQSAYFASDQYVLLKVNAFDCVTHQLPDETLTALAKIILRDPKNYVAYDDYSTGLTKEVVFPAPQDLTRLHIQLFDPYGVVMDLGSSQFSLTLEVLEVRNSSLYNTIRDSLTLQYV